jgi:uncharacterized cofD-like protein
MQKIVTIGGGTGQFQILRGLKNYECEITAVVNISDDGGSSGKLIDEYGILPPGDIRQCLIALSEDKSILLRNLFNYRLKDGHNLGNLIMTALSDIYGGDIAGIKKCEELLEIFGNVFPVSADKVKLFAETDNGEILEGQTAVSYPSSKTKIKKIYYFPEPFLYKEVADAIKEADKIIICPGDLYGSILPNFLVRGLNEAIKNSNAKKICVCNLFTKQGNNHFKASDFVKEIERYSGIKMDKIILNNKIPSAEVLKKYLAEDSIFVEDDLNDERVIREDLVKEYPFEKKTIFRHVPEKVARVIFSI